MFYIYFGVTIQNHGSVYSILYTMNVLIQVDQCFHNLNDAQLAFSCDFKERGFNGCKANQSTTINDIYKMLQFQYIIHKARILGISYKIAHVIS